jgi:hypothetical protein
MLTSPKISTGPSIDELSQRIKDRLDLYQLGEILYPGHNFDKNPCENPWVEQATGSFSIFRDGQKFNDFATGDHGDLFDFYSRSKGCDGKEAFRALKEMVLGSGTIVPATPIIRAPRPVQIRERIRPVLRVPTPEEVNQIGRLRSIDPDALQIAAGRGLLHTCTSVQYGECFVVTDKTGRNDRVRRLDGKPIKLGIKAICTPGSEAAWPIGITEAEDFEAVALTEGEGDCLAAFGFIHSYGADHVAPVCMGGASVSISPEAIEMFAGKRVRIFVQADRAGEDAWKKWTAQLHKVAAKVDGFDFANYCQSDESIVTDLNDLIRIHPDCFEKHREEIETIMKF